MKDTLPYTVECGIVNFNTHTQPGSHWVCYYGNKDRRIYFDSYGIRRWKYNAILKRDLKFQRGKEVIQRNTDIVQAPNTVCGHLCLYVLKSLSSGKFRLSPRKAMCCLDTILPVPFNPLHLQLERAIQCCRRYVYETQHLLPG